MPERPPMRLSVILTIVDGGAALERCLLGLAAQDAPFHLEVIVPWDDTVPGVADVARRFPAVTFLPLGHIETDRPFRDPAGQHELFDRRRAAGLAAASGEVIAILEDRGVPRPDWARTLLALHDALPHAAIGGAIENGRHAILNWAVFFCDFGRYQRPFDAGPRSYVSDVNIGYKRRALDITAHLWRTRYHETTVHWALLRAGETLYLSPEPTVDQYRDGLTLGPMLRERFAWGRLFAYTRACDVTTARRLWLAALAPSLPFVLFVRYALTQLTIRRHMDAFVAAAPVLVLLLVFWSLGEIVGYLTARP